MGYSAINQDVNHFSGLSRYQKANLELPRSNPKRIVFFGDSINRSLEPSRTFPNRPYINRGITRQTTFQMLLRFHQDVIDLHPAAVVILAGINDLAGHTGKVSLEQIEANHAAMAEMSGSNHIRVIFASVLPVRSDIGSTRRKKSSP